MSLITTAASRTLDGVEIPGSGTWDIDASHTTVGFVARHLMVAKVRGRFGSFAGSAQIADQPEQSSVRVEIEAASVDTHDDGRDTHLRSADFFDVETHPQITFVSTGFTQTGTTSFDLPGELTIRGVTRPVVLKAEFDGLAGDPWGGTRAAFTAATEIDREDFGLTWNKALESGGVLVGKTIKIEIDAELVRKA